MDSAIESSNENQIADTATSSSEDSTEYEHKQCEYGEFSEDLYLDTYVVKPGDTLLSIANHQLGSTARIDEIINANKFRDAPYDSLGSSDTIQAGWELYLSTVFLPPSSGNLDAQQGKLIIADSGGYKGRMLLQNDVNYNPVNRAPLIFAESVAFFNDNSFQEGDCIMAVGDRDARSDTGIIALAPQGDPSVFKAPVAVYEKHEVELPLETLECRYGFFSSQEVLRSYTVRPGDTLYSVANGQVGDISRVPELREINTGRYTSLQQSDFIEIGWELLLPPSWTDDFTGLYSGTVGFFGGEDKESFWIEANLTDHGASSSRFLKTPEMRYFGENTFVRGDCVVTFHAGGARALGIAPQSEDYLRYFKYGE
ncbi:MAG TPA: LysM peptidoglycan-binding domain-containing protein [Candidatus Paceibacterota bacterium]|nr:LysM peptidoglycan-binding domain-containing protein [Candidatus Paceibacterota bacterium]